MKNLSRPTLIILLLALPLFGSYAQTSTDPFEVTVSGNGAPSIIFIPGFACSAEVWKETKALFEKDFTCYTLTMAGFAGARPQAAPSFDKWEKAIAAYIREQKIHQPIVVGHSLGGGLAMALAADYPQLISRIVVVDALPCLNALMNPSFKADEFDCTPITTPFAAMTDEKFRLMQNQTVKSLVADTLRHAEVVSWSLRSDRATLSKMFCDFSATDLRDKISTIQCPALVLLEAPFSNFTPAIKGQFHKLETADIRYANKGLHFIMYDDNEWFNTELTGFIYGE